MYQQNFERRVCQALYFVQRLVRLCCPVTVWELCGTEQKKFVKISHKILILNSVKSITTGTKNDTSIIQTYQIGPNCSSNFKRIEKSAILCNKKSESAQSRFVPEVLLLNRWLPCISCKLPTPRESPYPNSNTAYPNSNTACMLADRELACFGTIISGLQT